MSDEDSQELEKNKGGSKKNIFKDLKPSKMNFDNEMNDLNRDNLFSQTDRNILTDSIKKNTRNLIVKQSTTEDFEFIEE